MSRQVPAIAAGAALALVMAGCQSTPPAAAQTESLWDTGHALAIPTDVQRIAVFYPRSTDPDFSEAYHRLEGAVFQLKLVRSKLKIVDRLNLTTVITELRFQSGGAVDDNDALRIGHMLGADSVLVYSIDGPTLRDRFMIRRRPIILTTKIIRVESAEVVYLDVVVAEMDRDGIEGSSLWDNGEYHRSSREALERGIRRTVADLRRAFQ